MNEAVFSKHLRDDIKTGLLVPAIKGDDGKTLKKAIVPHIYLIQDSYRSGKKPYDFYFVHDTNFYAIECKMCKAKSISMECVSQHQIDSLLEVYRAGSCGLAYVVICLHSYSNGKQALVIPIKRWIWLKKSVGSATIKIDELIERFDNSFLIMERKKVNGHLTWDIDYIVDYSSIRDRLDTNSRK